MTRPAGISRRALLGAAATGAAAAGLPPTAARAAASPKMRGRASRRSDVVVVGAGLSGLAAARAVARAGRSVLVLEARERVGGRAKNWSCGMGKQCDCGQVVGPRFTRMRELMKELGVGLYAPYTGGNDISYASGQRTTSPASGPGRTRELLDVVAPDARVAFTRLNEMARTVPREAPWETPNAAALDAQTFQTWKEENIASRTGRAIADLLVWTATSAEAGEVSLLHMLAYLARTGEEGEYGDTGRVFDFLLDGDLVDGGLQQVATKMAGELGKRVVVKSAVGRIVQRGRRVRVESRRMTVEARQVIVAMPPSVTDGIDYTPDLPPLRGELVKRYPQGTMVTFSAAYEKPFWRELGFTGRVGGYGFEPVMLCVDSTPPDVDFGILTGFATAAAGRRVGRRPAEERKQAALRNLVDFFDDRALAPMEFLERNWSVPRWTRGCPGFLPPGVLTEHGPAIGAPFGRVRWAGTEHSTTWTTYSEGAVRAGEKAARDALAAL